MSLYAPVMKLLHHSKSQVIAPVPHASATTSTSHFDLLPLPILLLRAVVSIFKRIKNTADLFVLYSDTFLEALALWIQDPKPNIASM